MVVIVVRQSDAPQPTVIRDVQVHTPSGWEVLSREAVRLAMRNKPSD